MIRGLSGHLNALYARLEPEAALRQAAADGFSAVEMWDAPSGPAADRFLDELRSLDLQLISVNTAAGPRPADFGLLGDPRAVGAWRDGFDTTLEFARLAGATMINVLAGGRIAQATCTAQLDCLLTNLCWALSRVTNSGDPRLLLEPLNGADRRSPLLRTPSEVLWVLAELQNPDRLKMLFDVYHVHQETPDLLAALSISAGTIGHVQVADYPGRAEPGTGVIPTGPFLTALGQSGYDGWLGLEYFPRASAAEGLGWSEGLHRAPHERRPRPETVMPV